MENCPVLTLGYILEGILLSERTPDTNTTTWLTIKGAEEAAWDRLKYSRGEERGQKFPTMCSCVPGLGSCSWVDKNFLQIILCICGWPMVCMGVKVKLSELRQRCGALGEVRLLSCSECWMVVGMVEVQSGLQLSCGEWPHRLAPGIVAAAQSHAGDREWRLHMNVGEGLDLSVDVDVNEPAWLRKGERQEEKERESAKFWKRGKRGPPGSQEEQGWEHTKSQRGNQQDRKYKHARK